MTLRAFRRLAAAALVVGGVAACDATPDYLKEEVRRARLAELGVEGFDSAGDFKLAGMSTHREVRIEPLRKGELKGDTLDPAYHLYHQRCGACHDVPSPSAKPAYLWDASLTRMLKNVADAGLMPPTEEELERIRRFLHEHADGG